MKTSKIDRIVTVVVIGTCLVKAVLYGGSKPSATTNTPSGDVSCPTNMVGRGVLDAPQPTTNENAFICGCGAQHSSDRFAAASPVHNGGRPLPLRSVATPQQKENEPSTIHNSSLILQNSWHTRGAFCDWTRVDFPSSFAFPCGTNLITSVTLMSYGEIRENLHCPPPPLTSTLSSPSPSIFTLSLPLPVSLEPGVSTCAYGLTASNSFVFAWTDACVGRESTNRVDAAIELFASGDVQVRFGDSVTNIVAHPPEGFVGEGQDDDWVTSAFSPAEFAAITNKGYEAWLMEDCVGHNEPNGRYKFSVTVASLPEHGPCYLVCGPYKMVVSSPGTYSFPLIDMTEYELYTCPTAVPLTWEMDDGWDAPESDSAPLYMSPAPRMLGAPQNNDKHYKVVRYPEVYIRPNYVTREEAMREAIELRCNAAGIAARDYRSWSGQAIVRYLNHSEAVLEECLIQDDIYFYYEFKGKSVGATLYINPNYAPWWHEPDPTNDTSSASSTNGNSSASNP